jgi:predicted ester cyclase
MFGMMFAGMPDMHMDMQRMTVDGDCVWVHGRGHGTNTGEMMGMPATGKSVDIDFIDILRFKDGKLVEHWGVTDNLGMMQQMGVVPMPEVAPA